MQSGNLGSIRRKKSKRVLAVKLLAAKTAWLDARLRWRDCKVVWDRPGGSVVPQPADLAAARRALDQIARYPVAASRALGDSEGLLERRRARLEVAKLLREVDEPDLSTLAREARGGSDGAVHRLLGTLVAGALCAEPLPVEPSRAVVACAGGAEPLLRRLLDDEEAPREGRALAALTLGALHGTDGRAYGATPLSRVSRDPWIRRAYGWGRRAGLPPDPTVVLSLLAEPSGEDLARRFLAAQSVESRFHLPSSLLRELFACNVPAAHVTEIVEACAGAAPVAERMLEYRSALPDPMSQECRRAAAERLAAEREGVLAELVAVVHRYVRSTPDAAVVRVVATLAHCLLCLAPTPVEVARALTAALRSGLDLSPEVRLPFLNLLAECRGRIWDSMTVPDLSDTRKAAGRARSWLQQRQGWAINPIRTLLERTRDARLVREAVERDIAAALCHYEWSEPERYRLVLELGPACDADAKSYLWGQLCKSVGSYKTVAAARAAIEPVVGTLADAPSEIRHYLVSDLLSVASASREARRIVLPSFGRFVDRLLPFSVTHGNDYRLSYCLEALVEVERAAPELADAVLELTLAYVVELKKTDDDAESLFVSATKLGLTIAGSDSARFKEIFDTILRSTQQSQRGWVAGGIRALERHSAVRAACVAGFARQSRRCISLLARFGQALELGAAALAPLAALKALVDEPGGEAAVYARARLLLGKDDGLPSGVRRALDLPRKLERELAYIDAMREREPEREDLASRTASLRGRLGDETRLRAEAARDASERLARATTDALLEATEKQVLACFRERLVSLVGAVPADLRFDDDMLNAILMSVDVTTNRKYLVQLIRAHVWGDEGWRERIPANAAFLESLAARGVDAATWLGAHPRWYDCGAASGKRVRLALERDPLRVLQMGNHFDTCLSVGNCNAFSAVTNACELNKRVVYATDAEGRVVGRKLIAIDDKGNLVGFQTYAGLHDQVANEALCAVFVDYVRSFAERSGLTLADKGEVPKLFAEDWYDDGVCAWDDAAAPQSE